jgi:hypothetical protein
MENRKKGLEEEIQEEFSESKSSDSSQEQSALTKSLTISITDPSEEYEINCALKGKDAFFAAGEFDQYLRNLEKYGLEGKQGFSSAEEAISTIREQFRETFVNDHKVDFDDI